MIVGNVSNISALSFRRFDLDPYRHDPNYKFWKTGLLTLLTLLTVLFSHTSELSKYSRGSKSVLGIPNDIPIPNILEFGF